MGLEKKYEYEGNKYISIGIESDAIKERDIKREMEKSLKYR